MKRLVKLTRIIAICLLFFVGVNAIIAGLLFMIDPSGHKMGMSTSYLSHSPFTTFIIPGITLLVVNGLLNILVAISTIIKYKNSPNLIIVQGILLLGWIIIQVLSVKDFNALHLTMLLIGSILLVSGFFLRNKLHHP